MTPRLNIPNEVLWHHSNGTALFPCTQTQHHNVDIIDQAHRERWPGFTSQVYKNSQGEYYHVGYHLVIDLINGTITRTRAFYEEGAHCVGKNRSSIGVLIIGNYDKCSGEVIPADKEYLIGMAWDIIKREYPAFKISDNGPHRKYASKSCYGDSLTDKYIQEVLLRSNTVQPPEEKEKEILEIETIQQEIIRLLTMLLSRLQTRATGKRLSLRELRRRPRP